MYGYGITGDGYGITGDGYGKSKSHLRYDSCYTLIISDYQGHASVNISNRYFTPRIEGVQETKISFSVKIDPTGILKKLAGTDLYHREDNNVHYFERIIRQNGGSR